jgi:hypothetical protein
LLYGSVPAIVQLAADILVGCVGPLGRAVIADSKSIDESSPSNLTSPAADPWYRSFRNVKFKAVDREYFNQLPERANSALIDLTDTLDRKRGRLESL